MSTEGLTLDAVVERFEQSRTELDALRGSLDDLKQIATTQAQARDALTTASERIAEVVGSLDTTSRETATLLEGIGQLVGAAEELISAADVSEVAREIAAVAPAVTKRVESAEQSLTSRIDELASTVEGRFTALEGQLGEASMRGLREAELEQQLQKALAALGPRKAKQAGLV